MCKTGTVRTAAMDVYFPDAGERRPVPRLYPVEYTCPPLLFLRDPYRCVRRIVKNTS